MTDRELLELAAKAAGYVVVWNPHWEAFQHRNPELEEGGRCRHPWLPLDDDGDAFRLAVKLQLQVTHGTFNRDEFSAFHACLDKTSEYWSANQCECAVTRRAIVRAAAALAKEGEVPKPPPGFAFATSADLAKEFGASDSEATAFQTRIERLAGDELKLVPESGVSQPATDIEKDALKEAVANLIKVKGRHHTEQAYQQLVAAYDESIQAQGSEDEN